MTGKTPSDNSIWYITSLDSNSHEIEHCMSSNDVDNNKYIPRINEKYKLTLQYFDIKGNDFGLCVSQYIFVYSFRIRRIWVCMITFNTWCI